MSLDGWDLVSVVDVAAANDRLRSASNELLTKFSCHEDDLRINGEFGSWQIVPSGSRQKLHVDLPIKKGEMRINPGTVTRYVLTGMVLRVELPLRLNDPMQNTVPSNLAIDLERRNLVAAHLPVTVVELIDPDQRIGGDDERILADSLIECLEEHQDKIALVFAFAISNAGLSM